MPALQPEILLHGGDLISASAATGIPESDWLDLSTGISPYAYPFTPPPSQSFTRLPYLSRSFNKQVSTYYDHESFLAIPGTQAVIQCLPEILPRLPVLLPAAGYQEHAQAWQSYGSKLGYYDALDPAKAHTDIEQQLRHTPAQHLLVINPNNPSTLRFSTEQLATWANTLENGACLVVDEAFIDSHPGASMLAHLSDNIIVLRSFGKFFGLAGIRLGFVFAHDQILTSLQQKLPLWSINGPAAWIAEQALADVEWQTRHQKRLHTCAQRGIQLFQELTERFECKKVFHEHLFSTYHLQHATAEKLFKYFYQEGILLRLIPLPEQEALIRIGRFTEHQYDKLRSALTRL